MNFFYLHTDPYKIAVAHADGHVNKMISEYSQLLSTAIRISYSPKPTTVFKLSPKTNQLRKKKLYVVHTDVIDENNVLQDYKVMLNTHENHPCNVWARKSFSNFSLLTEVLYNLHEYRWKQDMGKKDHASYVRTMTALQHLNLNKLPEGPITIPARAMPIHYYRPNVVESYRCYYNNKLRDWLADPKKARYAQYTNRAKPTWLYV